MQKRLVMTAALLMFQVSIAGAQDDPPGAAPAETPPPAGDTPPTGDGTPPTPDAKPEAKPDAAAPEAKQEEAPAPKWWETVTLSGFVDTYLGFNFNQPNSRGNALRNFDIRTDEASLSMAELAMEKKPDAKSPVGFRVDLDFGPTADLVHAGEKGPPTGTPPMATPVSTFNHIEQAYVSWVAPVGKGLQIDMGKMVTMAGAEVIEAKDNWNYSRSLLFAWAIPYYHAGVRLTYPVSDKMSLYLMVVNGWNNVLDNNNSKSAHAAVSYSSGALSVFADYLGGPEVTDSTKFRHLVDGTVTYKSGKMAAYVNGDFGIDTNKDANGDSPKWYGVAVAGRYQATEKGAVAVRAEFFKDANGFSTGTKQTLIEGTLTGEYAPAPGLIMRGEFRLDHSDQAVFEGKSAAKKNQPTVELAAIAYF